MKLRVFFTFYRSRPVGVVNQDGHILHFGTLPQYMPDLVVELLDWTKNSDVHMLIRSCVFHYELELFIPLRMETGVLAACSIRCCSLNGILLLRGLRWNP